MYLVSEVECNENVSWHQCVVRGDFIDSLKTWRVNKDMDSVEPKEPQASFAQNSGIAKYRVPKEPGRNKRIQRSNFWPGKRLDYEFLEKCKEVVCRVQHPTNYYQKQEVEFRVSIMSWSRGSYLDIRQYKRNKPCAVGILLHLDIISAILPDVIAAVRRMENEDVREPDKKAFPVVVHA